MVPMLARNIGTMDKHREKGHNTACEKVKVKVKVSVFIIIALIFVVHTRRSGTDHTVLPAITQMHAVTP